jgi:hypothetical protein
VVGDHIPVGEVDGLLQLALLWARRAGAVDTLPMAVDEVRVHRWGAGDGAAHGVVRAVRADATGAVCDAALLDPDGTPRVELLASSSCAVRDYDERRADRDRRPRLRGAGRARSGHRSGRTSRPAGASCPPRRWRPGPGLRRRLRPARVPGAARGDRRPRPAVPVGAARRTAGADRGRPARTAARRRTGAGQPVLPERRVDRPGRGGLARRPPHLRRPQPLLSGLPAHFAARGAGLGRGGFALDAACASTVYAISLAVDRAARAPGRADARRRGQLLRPAPDHPRDSACSARPARPGAAGRSTAAPTAWSRARAPVVVALMRLRDAVAAG